MKKINILLATLFLSVASYAQFTITTYDMGTLEATGSINDGDILEFNTLDYAEASIYFWINNDNSHDINVRIVYEDIVNADGVDFEFCFGELCIFSVEEGVLYPEEGGPLVIPAGGTNVNYDHFLNRNEGSGTFPMDYVIRVFEVDANDEPIGDDLTFIYRYDPSMSVSEHQTVNAQLTASVVTTQLGIIANENVALEIYNVQGKLLETGTLQIGTNNISVQTLASGLYFANLTSENGRQKTFKFVKK